MYKHRSRISHTLLSAFIVLWSVTYGGAALSGTALGESVTGNPLAANSKETSHCKDTDPIIFGILPFVSTEQLVIQFTPIAQYLSTNLEVAVRIETAPDFIEFARRTNETQRYDILFTAPHFYPRAHSKAGYRLIAGVDSPGMWAVIVVPRNSEIQNINDLPGKRLATVHPAGLATLLVKKYLSSAGIDPDNDITMVITPSHDASLLSSYHGVTDASALMQPPYEAASARVKENMRIIARTESTPHIPISVGSRINDGCAAKIAELLITMNTTASGKAALTHNNFSGFKKVQAEDYQSVSDLLTKKP